MIVASEADEDLGTRTVVDAAIQPAGFLLELSQDWIVLRASENIRKFLGEYHVTLIGEPLANFTMAQPLHDLRNALARQGSGSGIARAYRVRLMDSPKFFDFAFHLCDGRILLEGLPSADGGFGAGLGSVSRLLDGMTCSDRQALMDDATRRMRALTGFDRVRLSIGEDSAESSRGTFGPRPAHAVPESLPGLLLDTSATPVPLFPRDPDGRTPDQALLRSPPEVHLAELREQGVASVLNVPVRQGDEIIGWFTCKSRAACEPNIELHAAAELFAKVVALQLDGLE